MRSSPVHCTSRIVMARAYANAAQVPWRWLRRALRPGVYIDYFATQCVGSRFISHDTTFPTRGFETRDLRRHSRMTAVRWRLNGIVQCIYARHIQVVCAWACLTQHSLPSKDSGACSYSLHSKLSRWMPARFGSSSAFDRRRNRDNAICWVCSNVETYTNLHTSSERWDVINIPRQRSVRSDPITGPSPSSNARPCMPRK